MYIELEKSDYRVIAQAIADSKVEDGKILVDIDGSELEVKFEKDVTWAVEDDYKNGTGANVAISAYVTLINIKYENLIVEYDQRKIEDMTEKMIME